MSLSCSWALPCVREILIVEDSETDAQLLKRALQAAGVRNPIHHAWDGKQALNWLEDAVTLAHKEHSPVVAILFLDLKLPDLSGFDILTHIKEQPALAQTLRIVLSQMGDLDAIRRAYSLGAHSFLGKPASQHDLQELINGFPDHWIVGVGPSRSSGRQSVKNRRRTASPVEDHAPRTVQQVDGVPQAKFGERSKSA